jgi:hypothetical protein
LHQQRVLELQQTVKATEKQEKPQPAMTRLGRLVSGVLRSLAFDDLAGLDASRAHAHTLADAVHLSLDGLQIHVPAAPGGVVGVGDIVTELRTFAAEFTFSCHDDTPIFIADIFRKSDLSKQHHKPGRDA